MVKKRSEAEFDKLWLLNSLHYHQTKYDNEITKSLSTNGVVVLLNNNTTPAPGRMKRVESG